MESEQFFLKWNNFENNLTSGFADLLQQEAMVDVTLAAEGKIVQAHKIILSICSSYFRNMFQVNPCQHPIVVLKDVGYQELSDMLDFMYKGEANVKQQDLPSFLKLAETLKIKGLAGNQAECDGKLVKSNKCQSSMPTYTKDSLTNDEEILPKNDFILNDQMLRKKRKRSMSPKFINCESTKLPYSNNIKVEVDECSPYPEKSNGITCNQRVVVKEERLSDSSLDSYGNSQTKNDSQEVIESAGPSVFDGNCETVPQDLWNQRRTSKPLSVIWSFFNFDCIENKSECKLCGKIFKASPKTGTASVKYHLHFAHQIMRNDGGTQ